MMPPDRAGPSPSPFRADVLAGRSALVTGGSTGIGLAIAEALARHGASVHLVGRDRDRLATALAAVERVAAGRATVHAADVRDAEGIEALAQRVGAVDVLVNAAAGNFPVPFTAMSRNAWQSVVGIVLDGTANTLRSLGARMLEAAQGDGRARLVVNVVAGYAWTGAPGVAHSGAAKAGVLSLTRSLAVEWAPHVRVNAVSPGPVDGTEGVKRLADDLGLRARLEAAVPMGRLAQAAEVADAVLWLAGGASYVTGACVVVDGGMDAKGPFADVFG